MGKKALFGALTTLLNPVLIQLQNSDEKACVLAVVQVRTHGGKAPHWMEIWCVFSGGSGMARDSLWGEFWETLLSRDRVREESLMVAW